MGHCRNLKEYAPLGLKAVFKTIHGPWASASTFSGFKVRNINMYYCQHFWLTKFFPLTKSDEVIFLHLYILKVPYNRITEIFIYCCSGCGSVRLYPSRSSLKVSALLYWMSEVIYIYYLIGIFVLVYCTECQRHSTLSYRSICCYNVRKRRKDIVDIREREREGLRSSLKISARLKWMPEVIYIIW